MSQPTYFYYPLSTSTKDGVPATLLTDVQSLKLSRNIDEVAISDLQSSQIATSSAISSEVTRATGIDSTQGTSITNLNASIASLTSRAVIDESVIATHTTAITGQSNRLTTDEAMITANTSSVSSLTTTVTTMGTNIALDKSAMLSMVNNVTTRMGAAEASITSNAASITSETSRSTTEDNLMHALLAANASANTGQSNRLSADEALILANTSGLSSLTTRMGVAEAGVATNVSSIAAEINRASTFESIIVTSVTTEKTRALAAEGINATAISTERTRALAAEQALTNQIPIYDTTLNTFWYGPWGGNTTHPGGSDGSSIRVLRVGSLVTLTIFPYMHDCPYQYERAYYATSLPTWARPNSVEIVVTPMIFASNQDTLARLIIGSDGILSFYAMNRDISFFTTCGFPTRQTVSYVL